MRATDWARTPVGAVAAWPQSLRTAVSIMLESRFAMVVAWGREFRFFYNDRYRPILGSKHPAALGTPGPEIFPEVWDVVGPEFERVARGESFAIDDWLLPLERNGYLESCWFTLSYSPIRDESGGVGGVLAVVAETTGRVEGERRLATLRDLARRAGEAKRRDEACRAAADVFDANPTDVPFALVYLLGPDGRRAHRAASAGLSPDHPASRPEIDLAHDEQGVWPLAEALAAGEAVVVSDLPRRFGSLPGGTWPEATHAAVLHPLSRPGLDRPYGVLVAGVSPRRALDDRYRAFYDLAAEHIVTAISNATAFEEERRRAEALAQIDRAKTAFFSNVSHEFRTPLTLMLGPMEDALGSPAAALGGDELRLVHRNALRLLKLVNALLDFSRIEAGRIRASYQPTDLAAATADLASNFRSACEKAGLSLDVDVDVSEPAWVDRPMWEKVVLNLLSNAFKFTFEGGIAVRLRQEDDHFVLEVADTGTGIPEAELPRVFERFHRVAGARTRTEEGSGIGLALVQELARLHGGEARVSSRAGSGSTFTVTIPRGRSHLPSEQVDAEASLPSTATGAPPFVEEALRWIADDALPAAPRPAAHDDARILVADDNADMRDHLRRVLGQQWQVEAVADGAAALFAARARPPDLVLADVMMPGLDGFALLRALRDDERTREVPVVMLSARAGEEACVEGFEAGADEYLVKPFSARELVARVASQLALSRARREAALQKRQLSSVLMKAPTPICVLRGPRFVVELANDQCCAVWDRRPEDVLGRPLLDVLPEMRDQVFPRLLEDVLRTGTPYVGKEMAARFDRRGRGVPEDVVFNFIYDPLRTVSGEVDGILVMAFDVTDEVTAHRELDGLRAEAEAANRAKDEFLAMVSHELRNPLSPILTALHLLRLRAGPGLEREMAILDRQAQQLIRLVDDLMDVSRAARGKLELRREPVELAEVLAAAIETVSPLVEQKRHRLDVSAPSEGLRVLGDAHRLAQVFSNLLSNAAKFTEPGGRLAVEARPDGSEVVIAVRDDGPGIAPELIPSVFDIFVQGGRSHGARGGLGLGLAITKNIVTLHGGSVHVASGGPGRGTEFTVRLPLHAGAGEVTAPAAAISVGSAVAPGRRVLIVDDNRDAADSLAEALASGGYHVRVAYDAPTAVEAARAFTPEVALLDIGLPVLDGYEVARQLRALPGCAQVGLVAFSGYGFPGDRGRSAAAGFHEHLVKPLDPRQIEAAIARALEAVI